MHKKRLTNVGARWCISYKQHGGVDAPSWSGAGWVVVVHEAPGVGIGEHPRYMFDNIYFQSST